MSSSGPLEVKVCIIGDTDVGKTSLSMRYCHGEFPENATPTIGASFLQRRVAVDGTEISLQIWDTAGQERFRSMAPMYYRGAKAAIMVFDVTNEDTFHRVLSWLRDLKAHADPNVVICIAGNKCDKKSAFDISSCKEFAESLNAKFIRTSALTGEGVDSVFEELAKSIVEIYRKKGSGGRVDDDTDALRLDAAANKGASGACC